MAKSFVIHHLRVKTSASESLVRLSIFCIKSVPRDKKLFVWACACLCVFVLTRVIFIIIATRTCNPAIEFGYSSGRSPHWKFLPTNYRTFPDTDQNKTVPLHISPSYFASQSVVSSIYVWHS